jgi:acetylornithine deacetylase/succinyl-diaminopimelate desuccinylase-like protein
MTPMRGRGVALLFLYAFVLRAQEDLSLGERAARYLTDLIRLDTTNPPGNETRAAEYLKRVAEEHGIHAALMGGDPARLNFVARLRGSGSARPLLLMAHTDVVPADRAQWTVDPFSGEIRNGEIYGRGSQDDKNLLAAELAVLVELKLRGVALGRDIILLAEADEESGSTGIQWLIENAFESIDAEAALNEGGTVQDLRSGVRLFQIQTAEKIPTRVVLTARGAAGHASLPRSDNAIARLARALVRLEIDQPVRLNPTTRRYLAQIAALPDYRWLAPLVLRLEHYSSAHSAAAQIRARDPELDAQLRTTISPTMLNAGIKINVIPNAAEARLDVRRLPNESREEVLARIGRMIDDPAVEVAAAPGPEMPPTPPSPADSALYRVMERIFTASVPRAAVVPYMARGATDGAYLRAKGIAVYGVPLFLKEKHEGRPHGNDERISLVNLAAGTELLWKIVLAAAAEPPSR